GHGGDTMLFHSDLHLLLDKDIGIFMSFNSAGSPAAGGTRMVRAAIFHAFLDRYFPYEPPSPPTLSTAATDAARVVGWYQASRRNTSALRPLNLLSQVHVSASAEGILSVSMLTDAAGQPLHWREVAPLRYRQVHGQDRLVFVTDADGQVRYWTTDYIPPIEVFQPVPGAMSLGSAGPLMALSTVVMLITLLIWALGWWVRRHYRATLRRPAGGRWTRLSSRLGVLALVVVVVGWMVLIGNIGADPTLLLHGTAAPWMVLLYVFGVLALLGVVAMIVHAWRCWRVRPHSWWVRIGETVLALAAL